MRTELPDEQGWYWAKLLDNEEWCMAFVDPGKELVFFFSGDGEDHFSGPSRHTWDQRSIERDLGIIQWYGPMTCPGGDFGGPSVIIDEERHLQAALEKKAIVLTYVDFRHCKQDGELGSNITFSAALPRDAAVAYVRREFSRSAQEAAHE